MTTLLSYKSIDAEACQRRNNLIFWGIPESVGEDCIGTIKEFLSDKFSLDPDQFAYNVRTVWVVQEEFLKELSNTDRLS